jgi:transcription antitermination factor NusG
MFLSLKEPAWYCVRSTVGYELRAAELLPRLAAEDRETVGELETFCPAIRRLMIVGGKRRQVLSPLFPGYFFSRFCLDSAARYVASRPGVIGLVRFGEQAVSLPETVVEELKSADLENAPAELMPEFQFRRGQKLVIRDGPFAGMEGEYVAALNGGQRALLLLEYLHRRVNVVADYRLLEPAA